jgi:hypothetical protein
LTAVEGTPRERATRFRQLAEEVRAAAEGMRHAEARRALLTIAQNYERAAGMLEKTDAPEPGSSAAK